MFKFRSMVVDPRAVWTEEELLLEPQELTGMAQVNDVKSTNSEEKLRCDLQYVKEESFTLDVKTVVRQIWMVVDVFEFVSE